MDAVGTLAVWQEYFIVMSGAAAVLLGLVFVGVSLHPREPVGPGRRRDLAYASATSLFYALVVSLAMLIPEGRPVAQATLCLAFGCLGLWSSLGALRGAAGGTWTRPGVVLRFGVPAVAMAALIVAAIGAAFDWSAAVWLIAAITLVHVMAGTQNAWDLLLGGTTEE